jgi:hypothetical protein
MSEDIISDIIASSSRSGFFGPAVLPYIYPRAASMFSRRLIYYASMFADIAGFLFGL